jgi:hypothetical protein
MHNSARDAFERGHQRFGEMLARLAASAQDGGYRVLE